MNAAETRPPACGRPLRVLHLGSPTGLYGAERWILALVKYLPGDRIESFVGVIQDDVANEAAALCQQARKLGIPAVQFHAPGRFNAGAIGKLRRWLESENIDLLHTHGYKTDILGLLAARGTKCKVVATPHGWSTEDGVVLQIYEALDRLAFALMDAVVPLSADLLQELQRWPISRRKLHLIPNGVDIDEVQSEVSLVRRGRPSQTPGFVVGFIGRLVPQKGLSTLLHGFAGAAIPDKTLHIVGEGPQLDELKALATELNIESQVRFFGYRKDRLKLLAEFDVFALCSAQEGCPRALLEAMSARVPVAASDVPGCRDLVSHEDTGLLFPVGDPGALAKSLERLAQDSQLRHTLLTRALQFVEANYSARSMAIAYVDLYRSLAGDGNTPHHQVSCAGGGAT